MELGLKVGFKELRLEPKLLNRGLCKVVVNIYYSQPTYNPIHALLVKT